MGRRAREPTPTTSENSTTSSTSSEGGDADTYRECRKVRDEIYLLHDQMRQRFRNLSRSGQTAFELADNMTREDFFDLVVDYTSA